jgi:hypothetical protein
MELVLGQKWRRSDGKNGQALSANERNEKFE